MVACRLELGSQYSMHLLRLLWCGRLARANRPDRLIGDGKPRGVKIIRDRLGDLREHIINRAARFALLARLADAQDHRQSRRQPGLGLGADIGVAFTAAFAPLAMADDDQLGVRLRDTVTGQFVTGSFTWAAHGY